MGQVLRKSTIFFFYPNIPSIIRDLCISHSDLNTQQVTKANLGLLLVLTIRFESCQTTRVTILFQLQIKMISILDLSITVPLLPKQHPEL
jgi:hypothetical protein